MKHRVFVLLISLSVSLPVGVRAQEDISQVPIRLSLKDALQSVNTVNFQVMMANARLDQAIARIAEAQSNLLPHVDGLLSGARQSADLRYEGIPFPDIKDHIGPYNDFDARPRLTIPLFDPSSFERFQAAKKGEVLSQADLDKTREDVMALVANLFEDAQRKQQTVRLLKTLVDRDQMAYEISEDGYSEGTGTLLDSNKYKSDLDQTKYLYQQAIVQYEQAALDLEAALQVPLERPLVFVEDQAFVHSLENASMVNFNHTDNADIALASSQLEARKADQKSAYADFLPQVSGIADYGRSGESPSNGSNTYFVGAQVTVPLWDGGSQEANLKEVKGEVKEAQENLEDTTQQAQVNMAKARDAIEEAYILKESKAQEHRTAQRAMEIALHAQEIGSGTVLQVMQAKADLAVAEDEYNEAEANWVMTHIELLHAEGRLRELIKQEGA